MEKANIKDLKRKAVEIRKDILTMLNSAKSGHTGGSLSMVEILVALYYVKLKHNPKDPRWEGRDRFILSKGHGCPALYAVLADLGYFPKEELKTLRKIGSRLQGHPQLGLPGLEISSGSLGQGLSVAGGIAIGLKMNRVNSGIYCLMGDGETNEGQVWEAAMTAAHYKLDKLCAIIDLNRFQIDGPCCDIKDMSPMKEKWESFKWNAITCDGHDIKALIGALDKAESVKGKPSVILAQTVKGKGISFIENNNKFHGTTPKDDELEKALKELDARLAEIT